MFTVHNAVPHGFTGQRHAPTERIARLARTLVFVSRFSRDDFIARYGEAFRAKSRLLGIGLTPVVPGLPPVPYRPAPPPEALVYWSTVKPYKGVELFAELARSERAARRRPRPGDPRRLGARAGRAEGRAGGPRACASRTASSMRPSLLQLLARNVVFLLPYREATQSGALFSLLHHGRVFLCTDVGDLGDFLRRFGLEALLLRERSADAVGDALERLRRDPAAIAAALQAAQDASAWATTNAGIAAVYAGEG